MTAIPNTQQTAHRVQVVIVDTDGTVTRTHWTPENGSLLPHLWEAIGDTVTAVALQPELTMYLPDNGFAKADPNPIATLLAMSAGRDLPYFGTAVFIGGLDAHGEDESLSDELAETIATASERLAKNTLLMQSMHRQCLDLIGRTA